MNTIRSTNPFAIALVSCCLGVVASPVRAADWDWTLTPYLWATDVGVDVTINSEPVLGTEVEFKDLFDKLEFAAPLHFEGSRGKSGFFLDVNYIKLGETQTTVAQPPLPGGTTVASEVEQLILEAGGFYRLSGEAHGLDLLYGVRVMDLEMALDIALPAPSTTTAQVMSSGTFTDGFLGLRYQAPVSERASIGFRGDIGTGGSDLTWNVSALLGFQVGKKRQNTILVGYRHMVIELENSHGGVSVESELTMSGPITGFAIRF